MKHVVALVLVLLFALPAHAVSLRKQCQRQCKETVGACVQAGGHRRKCKRNVLKQCRTDGLVTCVGAPTTTTTLPSGSNSCTREAATDLTGQAAVTIEFGDAAHAFAYAPPCFRVSPGTQVTFSGPFAIHPLVGGVVSDTTNVAQPDPTSPFQPPTTTGASKTFTLTDAGVFPFYCNVHSSIGMKGAAFVGP